MTEEKTCYNCGNKNCNVYYSIVKKNCKRHYEIFEYRNFDCVNHDKWEELKVEEIRTDNTETLKNALERIKELEKANEWHYVKDGDLPNVETKNYTYIRRRKRYERHFTDYRVIKCFVLCLSEKGNTTAKVGYFDCNRKCFFDEAEGMVFAWKEIVLPLRQ